ncbi:DUF424 domain-containing protein [Candidatus Woesearchaeota archaeon]|nr:DUF424 domain-containing protein [Candidatus Woesearchaeota archaeon]
MIFVKEHIHNDRKLISLCDGNLIGKEFEEKDFTIKISKSFYLGEPMFEKEIIGLAQEGVLLNIIGEESVNFALKNNLIQKAGIKRIKNIPFALVL